MSRPVLLTSNKLQLFVFLQTFLGFYEFQKTNLAISQCRLAWAAPQAGPE